MDNKHLKVYVDGASRGNPGPASYGVCIYNHLDRVVKEVYDCIGIQTNNVAEYHALIRGLEESYLLGAEQVHVFTDSELITKQFNGIYKVKHQKMFELLSQVRLLVEKFQKVTVQHIPRSSHPGNQRADQLANIALDKNRFLSQSKF